MSDRFPDRLANGRKRSNGLGISNGLTVQTVCGLPPVRQPAPITHNIFNNNNNIYIQEAQGGGAGERDPRPFGPLDRMNLRIVANNNEPDDLPDDEPTDEELWLEETARQVEADARPLFAAALAYLFRRALELDDNEPGDAA